MPQAGSLRREDGLEGDGAKCYLDFAEIRATRTASAQWSPRPRLPATRVHREPNYNIKNTPPLRPRVGPS